MKYRLALKNTFLHVKEVEFQRARATSAGLKIRINLQISLMLYIFFELVLGCIDADLCK